ncbi:MAG: serine/threonine protein kinase [bacterium]|nr:serine/threonine protein kinase [bacterium]
MANDRLETGKPPGATAKTGPSDDPQADRIASLVNQYFDRRQDGEDLTPEQFSAEHPDLAAELQPYLQGLALLDEIRTATADTHERLEAALEASEPAELPTIDGYELIEEIGRGGMGVVYKALQVATKRVVALKVMLAGPFASPTARRRFEREVELAARLRHESIVTVLESGQVASGQKYFAMDYVDGVHLDTYLIDHRPDRRARLELFARICEAVDYAHEHNVIHRDLKPANVLIDGRGDPHIMDFGLAKATDQGDHEDVQSHHASAPGVVMGTLRYLSPEQAAGATESIDGRTDVYALGIMLFEAVTGALPYDTSGRASDVVRRIIETPPALPASLPSRIDKELITVLFKPLEKERRLRYISVGEMGEDLRRYLAGEPVLAKRASPMYVVRKKLAKHRSRIALAAAALGLAVGSVWGGIWWTRQSLEGRPGQQFLTEARREVLRIQHELETGNVGVVRVDAHRAFAWYPMLPEARLVAAQVRWQLGYTSGAIWFLETELRRDPSQWSYRALLANLYRDRAARGEPDDDPDQESDSGDYDPVADLNRAEQLEAEVERDAPDTADGWYLRSYTALDLEAPMRCVRTAIERDPTHLFAWIRLVDLAQRRGDYESALEAADALVELSSNPSEWQLRREFLLTRQRETDAAEGAEADRNATSRPSLADPRTSESEPRLGTPSHDRPPL